jgi:hypothetical protein
MAAKRGGVVIAKTNAETRLLSLHIVAPLKVVMGIQLIARQGGYHAIVIPMGFFAWFQLLAN